MNRADRPWKQPGRQWLAAHFGGPYPQRSPSVRWTRKGTSLPKDHCRSPTDVVKARPQVRKGAAPMHAARQVPGTYFASRLTIFALTLSKSHLCEHKLICTTMQSSIHRHMSAPTAPSRTSDDKYEAVPRRPTAQSAGRYYLDRKYSSVLFTRVRQTNKVKNRQPTKWQRALFYMLP